MYNHNITVKRSENKSLYNRLNRIAATRKHSIFVTVCPHGVDFVELRRHEGQWGGGSVDYVKRVADGCGIKTGYFRGKPATPSIYVGLSYCAKYLPEVFVLLPAEYQVAADAALEGIQ